jgi:hypothetical protein
MACKTKPSDKIAQLLGECLDAGAPAKVRNLTVADLWRVGGFRRKNDPPTSQNPNLNLSPAEKKVLADAFICYIESGNRAEPKGEWTYDMNYLSVCCCCTT